MTRPQRSTVVAIVAIVVSVAVCVGTMVRINNIVHERRAQARQRDVHLCEVAINVNNAKFLRLIDNLSKISPPPSTPEEAAQREASRKIITDEYKPTDCPAFVAAGGRDNPPTNPNLRSTP